MSSYIFSLTDISIANNSPTVTVNNTDSFFGVIEGSQLFIAGKLPATIIEHDTAAKTLTLSANWAQGDVNNVSAQVLPLGAVATLLTALENNRAAYQAFIENSGGAGGSGEISFSMIVDPPQTATQWPTWQQVSGDIGEVLPTFAKRWPEFTEVTSKPDTATRWPKFSEVTETVSESQLPSTVTANKRSLAESPPVKQNTSLTHILSDYPTLKKTIEVPTYSPNNKREMLFDDVRQSAYIALTDDWLKVPNVIATREFLLTTKNRRFYFESNYTGDITLRIYPMGNGGNGLPTNPALTNFGWHTVTVTVTDLGQFGSDFVGLVDFIQTDTGFETLSAARSLFSSVGIYYGDSNGNVAENQFIRFSLRQDGHWYSSDVMPETPFYIGASWSQDSNNKKLFTVDNADGGTDALRTFSDSWDNYEFELVIVTDITNPMALTISNAAESTIFFPGTYRFITQQDRLYLKRQAGFAPIDGSVLIESLRLRVKHYE